MSIDVEYAIKQDVRNNPIVREVDQQQRQDFLRLVWRAGLVVVMVLVWAWQHYEVVNTRFALSDLRKAQTDEAALNRTLRLQVETMTSPEQIERRATQELHMAAPTVDATIVLQLASPSPSGHAVVASNR